MARTRYCIRCGKQTTDKYYCSICQDERNSLTNSFTRIIKENPDIEPESLAELLAWHALDEITTTTVEAWQVGRPED